MTTSTRRAPERRTRLRAGIGGRSRRVDVVDEADADGERRARDHAAADVPAAFGEREPALSREHAASLEARPGRDAPERRELRRERARRHVASLPGALRIAGHGNEASTSGRGSTSATSAARLAREPRASSLLPAAHEAPARARRRRSPSAPSRTRAFGPEHSAQRRTGHGPGEPQRSHTGGARRVSDAGTRRRARDPAGSQTRSAPGAARSSTRTPSTLRGKRHGFVPSSCQIGDAETSSRRSSCARSRSAGVLIGKKRPRGPRRGTSRYGVGTNADTSW